ncbi:hypothetical protein DY000_02016634 [Brassica cretica]|uniref:Uncharacterized protein n=1 Tax=Brassica cretica TaxID=69181 RepID=A0ABQ7CYC1_BRACR|nr:hypothetical protein DY000_02016634 [Brassica cretica]
MYCYIISAPPLPPLPPPPPSKESRSGWNSLQREMPAIDSTALSYNRAMA